MISKGKSPSSAKPRLRNEQTHPACGMDSGVLIAAARGTDEAARRAMAVLDDPERSFASSAFVRLEVLPKALRHRREAEARFYETFFQISERVGDHC